MMYQKNIDIAQAYYTAMAEKNIVALESFLDTNVIFVAPLATRIGKDEVVGAIKNFMAFFITLTIRAQFGSQDQALIVYTLDFPAPIGKVETVALLNIKDGLVTKIELFYDARPFTK